jgi:hypothetical protein
MSSNNNSKKGNLEKPHSDLYYSLIRSKEFFSNKKNTNSNSKGSVSRGNMMSPDSNQGSGSQSQSIIEIGVESSSVNLKVDPHAHLKELIAVHVSEIELLKSSTHRKVHSLKPPKIGNGKLTLIEESSFLHDTMLHNLGNKIVFNVLMMGDFKHARETLDVSLGEIEGVFEMMTLYASLLGSVLKILVWPDVEVGLIFKKMKSSMTNIRANSKKAK